MKTSFQILVILVVAALIGGIMYGMVNAAGAQTQTRGDFDGGRPVPPNGEFREGGHEPSEGGVTLPFGAVKSLAVVSMIGAPYFWWRNKAKTKPIR